MERDADHIPFVSKGSYPPRPGNAVRPLVDGEPAFRRIAEAVEAARHSVWLTVAFYDPAFEMPDGRGSLFDVLDAAVDRGLDVRVIFWRHTLLEQAEPGVHFPGTAEQRAMLARRGSRFQARWDAAHGRYCQHQKSWLVDAGQPGETAFVGGINLNPGSVVPPGHPATDAGNTHDVYVEVRGPSATDVHHNFVQRWNEASERDAEDGLWPDASRQDTLAFPGKTSPEAGDAVVQIQRTVRRGRYTDGTAAPGAAAFPIADGEHGILEQYLGAIAAAKRTLYFEDQAIGAPQIVDALAAALERGVHVVFLVPIDPHSEMAAGRADPANAAFFERLASLGGFDHFALTGIVTPRADGAHQNVYVHAKIALVDDAWCTIGSANVGNRSFFGDTELNASIWHRPTVQSLRAELLEEHIGHDTRGLDDVDALALYRQVARENTRRRVRREALQGLAIALDPATYGA